MKGGAIVLQDRRSKLAESRTMMSPVGPNQDEPPVAARAGADLRAARERLGWELSEIAAGLRIRQPHLEALEEGRIDLLPGHAYVLGFLRTYAASLGLDPEEVVRRFKAEAGEVTPKTELAFPAPMPERGVPAGAVVLLGLVLVIGAYIGWYRLSGEGRLPPESTAIPHRLEPLAQRVAPSVRPAKAPAKVATRTQPAATAPAQVATTAHPSAAMPTQVATAAQPPVTASTSALTAAPPAIIAMSPSSAAAAPLQPADQSQADQTSTPVAHQDPGSGQSQQALAAQSVAATSLAQNSVPAAASAPPVATPANSAAAPNAPPQVVLRATADAWVQVRNKSGQVLLNRILHAGDTWQVPDRPNLLLTTGNAGGTEVEVNGVSSGVLGASGAVRRDLPLDPAAIKNGALKPASANGVQQASLHALSR